MKRNQTKRHKTHLQVSLVEGDGLREFSLRHTRVGVNVELEPVLLFLAILKKKRGEKTPKKMFPPDKERWVSTLQL